MKVLHINASDVGSTGKIIQDISGMVVAQGGEAVALFPKRNREPDPQLKEYMTALPLEQGVYRRLAKLHGLQYGFAPVATIRILEILRKERPDVVHLHCLNSQCVNIYRLLKYLKKRAIPTVVTNHAEFFYTGNCAHAFACDGWQTGCHQCGDLRRATGSTLVNRTHLAWVKMKEAFQGHPNIHIVSVSPWVYNRSATAPILEGLPQSTILNGINSEIFCYKDPREAREALGLPQDEKIILHVTANFSANKTDSKGGRYMIALAEQLKERKVKFLVAGRNRIEGSLPENMILLGPIKDQKMLAEYYAAADLTVLVSQRETFGMAVAESLCCGTPVVGFESGGSESIAIPEFSEFVSFGDIQELQSVVTSKWLSYKTAYNALEISKNGVQVYSADRMSDEYIALYKAMMKKCEN